jgi:hypothetical protein
MKRRTFLKVAGMGLASSFVTSPVMRALADAQRPSRDGQFFVFVHAAGGWDVTLWADPRNERAGLVQPASTANTDTSQVKRWVDAPLDESARTFQLVRPSGSNIVFGPGIGDLADLHDRLTVINGLAMNTVSHPDGTAFSATGRHLVGGRVPASSIDTLVANELGREQTFPVVSIQFPSSYVGDNLDRRVVPLAVGNVSTLSRALTRSSLYDSEAERDEVTSLLSREAAALAAHSEYPDTMQGMSVQLEGLRTMLGAKLQDIFTAQGLQRLQPQFNYRARFAAGTAVNAAFAVEAMKRNVVRCVSFAQGGFDTHNQNYKQQAQTQQELFDTIAVLVRTLDQTPHPTLTGHKLADATHIVVISDFCRTPQINTGQGRDHYPNNSALLISPRIKSNFVFGSSDKEQLLPAHAKRFVDGERAVAPPDVLATLLAAIDVDPRKYMRDGEVVRELLRG